jgi:Uma2 family endonuclease
VSFGGFGGEGYEFESRPEVDAWLRDRATDAPAAPTRFEVLDGDRIALPPVSQAHAACTTRLTHILTDALGDLATVSVQNPISLDQSSQPCPDIAVLVRRSHGYQDRFAAVEDILLLVEVADSSFELTHDRGRKSSLYAHHGITECWIVDLQSGQILVHRSPASGGYRDIRHIRPGSTIASVGLPDYTFSAQEILGAG